MNGDSDIEGLTVDRFVSPQQQRDDHTPGDSVGHALRPRTFLDYPGQENATDNLKIYVEAAKKRDKPIDHILLHGPPGLGKTTLACIIANELSAPFYQSSGPSLDKPGDLAGILASLEPGALLFIDEIHRLSIQVEEVLYGAMEDFAIDLMVGQGPTARSIRMPINPFTLVGATTKLSLLSRPFLSRFGIQERLDYYAVEALTTIVIRSARLSENRISCQGAEALARRSRGTPRIANRLLRRVADFASVAEIDEIDQELVASALERLGIDEVGLDQTDRQILSIMHKQYQGGPVGIEAIAVALGDQRSTVEEVYEPYLIYKGFVSRGLRGRKLTASGLAHLQLSQ